MKRTTTILSQLLAFGLLATGLGACGNASDNLTPGDVVLDWQVGARGCAATDTATVRITTDDGIGETEQWIEACESEQATLAGLRPGNYVFVIEGLSPRGTTQFIGETDVVEVRSGGLAVPPRVHLESTPAELTMEWTFGGPLCSQVGVEFVEVLAVDMQGTIEAEIIVPCDDGRAVVTVPPRTYDIVVSGQDLEGKETYIAIMTIELDTGDRATRSVELSATN